MQIEIKENEITLTNVNFEEGVPFSTPEEDVIMENALRDMGVGIYTIILRKEN
jgi:hypothetical protein